jgi:hypothetical protein
MLFYLGAPAHRECDASRYMTSRKLLASGCARQLLDLVFAALVCSDVFRVLSLKSGARVRRRPPLQRLRVSDPEAFRTLTRVPATFQKVHYKRERPVELVFSRCHIHLNKRDEVTAVYWAPPFEGPLRVPAEDVMPYYRAYKAFGQVIADTSKTRCVRSRFVILVWQSVWIAPMRDLFEAPIARAAFCVGLTCVTRMYLYSFHVRSLALSAFICVISCAYSLVRVYVWMPAKSFACLRTPPSHTHVCGRVRVPASLTLCVQRVYVVPDASRRSRRVEQPAHVPRADGVRVHQVGRGAPPARVLRLHRRL